MKSILKWFKKEIWYTIPLTIILLVVKQLQILSIPYWVVFLPLYGSFLLAFLIVMLLGLIIGAVFGLYLFNVVIYYKGKYSGV
jgi:hypothetical protein